MNEPVYREIALRYFDSEETGPYWQASTAIVIDNDIREVAGPGRPSPADALQMLLEGIAESLLAPLVFEPADDDEDLVIN